MTERLAAKVAIVTGAASGNGRGIAETFAREGARVVCADRDEAGVNQVVEMIQTQGGQARAVSMDVTRPADCARTVAEALAAYGGLDILVNNAGILLTGAILDTPEEDWDRVQAVNVKGVYLLTKAALPAMIERGGGSVIIVASLAGLRPRPRMIAYVTSKHAVIGMTRALAIDYAPRQIRVNAICPGPILTGMTDPFFQPRGGRSREDLLEVQSREIPLGRIGQPDDVAAIALHFASDEAGWTTGICYPIDGGNGLANRMI